MNKDALTLPQTLPDLLNRCAEQTPDSIAIEFGSDSIDYRSLNQISNQLANVLSQSGVEHHQRIGLLVDKNIAAYAAIYGILRAGCAYVPLDKRAPADRLSYICSDCTIDTLVITEKNLPKFRQIAELTDNIKRLVIVDSAEKVSIANIESYGRGEIESAAVEAQQQFNIVDSDLAYILYTSGSTGQPKGVMINHHTSMSFVKWAAQHTRLSNNDRVSGHAPLHFDLSIFDIYATAYAGATLLPVPDGASTFPSRLLDWMISQKISVWYSVPSMLSMMTQHKHFNSVDFSQLRLIIFAGEVFPVPYLKLWRQRLPDLEMMNWFGPTETNVITSYTVTLSAEQIDRPIPIGKTTNNADLLILNEAGERVTKAGQSGEIVARGPCVALGYWGDEAKTRDKFIANPEQPWLDERLFKTGDIVSLDERGDFVFLGRNDHLVKSRGYRIELGEVEAALYQLEESSEAAVIPLPDELIGNKLIAFVAVNNADTLSNEASNTLIANWNKTLSKQLPHYMIPGEIHIQSVLPKTSNGKIDRQRLSKTLNKHQQSD